MLKAVRYNEASGPGLPAGQDRHAPCNGDPQPVAPSRTTPSVRRGQGGPRPAMFISHFIVILLKMDPYRHSQQPWMPHQVTLALGSPRSAALAQHPLPSP
jgi:hypothetical protein